MVIYLFCNEKSFSNLEYDVNIIDTEEDFEEIMNKREVEEVFTTCTIAFNRLQAGDYLRVYDKTGAFTITFDGELYHTYPQRTEKELRKEHNMEKLWRSGAFTLEVKNNEN